MSKTIDVFCPTCGHMAEVPRTPLPGERRPPGYYWARYDGGAWTVVEVTYVGPPDNETMWAFPTGWDGPAEPTEWGPRIEPPSEAKT